MYAFQRRAIAEYLAADHAEPLGKRHVGESGEVLERGVAEMDDPVFYFDRGYSVPVFAPGREIEFKGVVPGLALAGNYEGQPGFGRVLGRVFCMVWICNYLP